MNKLLLLLVLMTSALMAQNAGVGFVGSRPQDINLLARPYMKFGAINLEWKDIEPNEGEYNWSSLDSLLKIYHELGKAVPIRINTPVPNWIFKYVADVGTSRGGNAPQYWDPRYLKILEKMISHYAEHLGTSPYKSAVMSVRMQYNALNTEIVNFDAGYLHGTASADRTKWKLPPDGHVYKPDLTPQLEGELMQKITEMYMTHFYKYGIAVTLRLPSEAHLTQRGFDGKKIYDHWCENPLTRLLTTHYSLSLIGSEEANTFRRRCRELGTAAFMEQFGSIEILEKGKGVMSQEDLKRMRTIKYFEGEKLVSKELSKEQAVYWSMLMLLDWGGSYLSLYSRDMDWVDKYPELPTVFEFINRYAGYQATPEKSPGAWRVFGEFFPKNGKSNSEKNWGWYLREQSMVDTVAVNFPRGRDDVVGVYARRLNGPVKFILDPKFLTSLSGKCTISLVHLSSPDDSISIEGAVAVESKPYSGQWIKTRYSVPSETIANGLTLTPKGQPNIHLLEVTRAP